MYVIRLVFVVFLITCDLTNGANILAVIPSPFYSHQATFRPLWKELARKGHSLTLITTDPMEANENITQININKTYEIINKFDIKKMFINNFNIYNLVTKFVKASDELITYQFTHPDFVELMKEGNFKFDLLMMEMMPSWAAISCKFNIPYIHLTTMDAFGTLHGMMGNAMHPAIYPSAELGYEAPLTFKQRLFSTGTMLIVKTAMDLFSPFLMDKHIEKHIAKGCPISKIQTEASLLFVNANPVFYQARPITPTTINLGGGLHFEKPRELPKDLQKYLDESEHGCIYFSFGTTVNSDALTPEMIEIFRKTFQELAPMRILWKFENKTLPGKPKNLEIRKWLPQQDILRHPNIKLFITQGGLQSMEEALEYAVPMLGMPFYGDQHNNVNKMVRKQFGVMLDPKMMDQKSLKAAIHELLKNPIYRKNIEKYSKIQRDRPMRALDTAVWWTEYVIRHGGTEHLRSPSADIPLYQYFFLDIIAFVVVVLILVSLVLYYSFKLLIFTLRKIFKLFVKKNKQKIQ